MKSEKLFSITPEEFDKIMTNPFYCLPRVHEKFFYKHEPMLTEAEFVKAGLIMIEEIGAKRYIELLLENLKGNDPHPGITEFDIPDGYKLNDLKGKVNDTKPADYLAPEDEQRLRDFVASLSDDPEWKEKARTLSGKDLIELLETNGFTRKDEE